MLCHTLGSLACALVFFVFPFLVQFLFPLFALSPSPPDPALMPSPSPTCISYIEGALETRVITPGVYIYTPTKRKGLILTTGPILLFQVLPQALRSLPPGARVRPWFCSQPAEPSKQPPTCGGHWRCLCCQHCRRPRCHSAHCCAPAWHRTPPLQPLSALPGARARRPPSYGTQ